MTIDGAVFSEFPGTKVHDCHMTCLGYHVTVDLPRLSRDSHMTCLGYHVTVDLPRLSRVNDLPRLSHDSHMTCLPEFDWIMKLHVLISHPLAAHELIYPGVIFKALI